jgi:tRNA-2-methylthio-N6-dimethylallyladenosine synthase
MKYFIKTFGCQQNVADSERVAALFKARGMKKAKNYHDADYIIINTCMVRHSAENRIYGLIENLKELKIKNLKLRIILTGCMVGLAYRDKTGKYLKRLKNILPGVDEFMPIEEVGFGFLPLRSDKISAWVPISNGCNNFCSYCVVPYTRGREISRPYKDIINECRDLKKKGYKNITLLGQNVNSYGSDLLTKAKMPVFCDLGGAEHRLSGASTPTELKNTASSFLKNTKPIYVKHLGRYRIPALFPHLLEDVAKMGFDKVDFISSNPWDFSDELIAVIARNKNITRTIHLPVQSGDDNVLKRMNRWYTAKQYLALISKIKKQISKIKFTTDIIVGFSGETDKEFKNTVKLCKKVGFEKAYIAMYSPRPMTIATKKMMDDVPHTIKKQRWQTLEDLINQRNLKKR